MPQRRSRDYTLTNRGGVFVAHRSTHYHRWSNLSQYHYVQKKYARKTREQTFWTLTALLVVLLVCAVALQFSETDAQRKYRIQRDEAAIDKLACQFGPKACAVAKEESRKVICRLFPEECYPEK